LSDDLPITPRITIPGWELDFASSRSSGPGGQSVNKTNSRVTLRWHVASSSVLSTGQKSRLARKLSSRIDGSGFISIHAESARSQLKNKELARERLAQMIAEALIIPKRRRATKPSRASKQRRIDKKKKQGQKKAMRQRPSEND